MVYSWSSASVGISSEYKSASAVSLKNEFPNYS